MPQNDAAAIDPIAGTGSFSRLLFSDIEVLEDATVTVIPPDRHHHHPNTTVSGDANRFTFSTDKKSPKMLCFSSVSLTPQNSTKTTTADHNNNHHPSPPLSATTTTTSLSSSNSNIKRNMKSDYHGPNVVVPSRIAAASPVRTTAGRHNKKMRAENTPPASHAKVKKEKLGERIAALQQMVSPYGKTDTASVLHEAMGYIKFLQEQVHVLCSPYLQQNVHEGGGGCGERKKLDLRSRGLCLVPVECTLHVAESNGADMWSPASHSHSHGSLSLQ